MKPLSLKWRVSLLVTSAILFASVVIAVAGYVEMKEALVHELDRTLQSMAACTLADLQHSGINNVTEAEMRAILGAIRPGRSPCFRLWFDGSSSDLLADHGDLEEHSRILDVSSLAHTVPPALGGHISFDAGQVKDEYRAIWMRSRIGENGVNIAIAVSSQDAHIELAEHLTLLLLLGGGVALITIVATTFLVGLGLRPISQTAQALRAITDRNVNHAGIETDRVPADIEPFTRAVSDVLARLANALTEQKRFVSDASHELRTPLSVARSTIDAALVKNRTPAEYRTALGEVRDDLDRMGAVTEELLLLARLDETAPTSDPETFDLASLLGDLARRYETKMAQACGHLNLNLHPVNVRGDEEQIGRLFSNLLDNAVQHGPKGGTIGVSVEDEGDDAVVVCVHDEGGAIPVEALQHIFDRFCRADQSRSRATGGVGLGLSIAREIARRHGGDIVAMSSPHTGTSFRVSLPKAWRSNQS
jgi:signal transduction histidine kinase